MKEIFKLSIVIMILSSMGCSLPQKQNMNYQLCNDTSMDNMAEIESGFFYIYDKLLYYADKSNMTTWVPVCNKANCVHNGTTCNAYVGSEIAQKGDKLYFVSDRIDYESIGIYEISTDGSGFKKAYEIPFWNEILGFRGLISSSSLILSYTYLTEDGMYESNIARLEEDGTLYHMYSEITESKVDNLFMSGSPFFVKGEEVILSSRLTLKYTTKTGLEVQNVLWRMDGDEPELVNVPDDVLIGWSYLSDDFLIDYEGREGYEKGYYKYDLNTGEKTLLGKAEQDNAWGYIMSENCVVESNRYLNQSPKDAYLKIYYDERWIEVSLPEVITKFENTSFSPISMASDRIFFMQDINGKDGYSCRLYYVMLDDKNPKLTYCTTFGNDSYFEIPEESFSNDNIIQSDNNPIIEWQDLDITVFDTEEYLIKVIGVGMDQQYKTKGEEVYKVTMYCENRTDDQNFSFILQDAAINGIFTSLGAGFDLNAKESKEHNILLNETFSSMYSFEEFTDISFLIYEFEDENNHNIIHVYPQGEEKAILHEREKQDTDEILVNNEYVTVTIIGYESTTIPNDTVKLFIENKSDMVIEKLIGDIEVINGIKLNTDGLFLKLVDYPECILPHSCYYTSIKLQMDLLEANDIEKIENWEMSLKILYGENWDEELINDIFTITP